MNERRGSSAASRAAWSAMGFASLTDLRDGSRFAAWADRLAVGEEARASDKARAARRRAEARLCRSPQGARLLRYWRQGARAGARRRAERTRSCEQHGHYGEHSQP